MPYEMLTSQLTCLRLPNRGLVGWSLSVGPLLVAAFSVVSPRPVTCESAACTYPVA